MSMRKSLGLVEAKGLCAGVVAADVVVKAANVKLIGYEFARGDGWTTVKVTGDVGAVKAAVSAAVAYLNKMGKLATYKVIARPSDAIEMLTYNPVTVGYTPDPAPEPPTSPKGEKTDKKSGDEVEESSEAECQPHAETSPDLPISTVEETQTQEADKTTETSDNAVSDLTTVDETSVSEPIENADTVTENVTKETSEVADAPLPPTDSVDSGEGTQPEIIPEPTASEGKAAKAEEVSAKKETEKPVAKPRRRSKKKTS